MDKRLWFVAGVSGEYPEFRTKPAFLTFILTMLRDPTKFRIFKMVSRED